jgi:hypothetical protein
MLEILVLLYLGAIMKKFLLIHIELTLYELRNATESESLWVRKYS